MKSKGLAAIVLLGPKVAEMQNAIQRHAVPVNSGSHIQILSGTTTNTRFAVSPSADRISTFVPFQGASQRESQQAGLPVWQKKC